MRVAAEHPRSRLTHDALDQRHRDVQSLDQRLLIGWASPPQVRAGRLGVPHDGPGDSQEASVQVLHPCLALFAYRRRGTPTGSAATLSKFEDAAADAACSIANPAPETLQSAGDHPHSVGQQRAVRRMMDVRLDDGADLG